MSKNADFGRRIKRARVDLGIKRKRLAELAGIELFRLEMFESEQMDESDLTDEEMKRLSKVLGRSATWLIHGLELADAKPSAGTIARRLPKGALQQEIDFGLENCPRCFHRLSSGSACDNCGLRLD